MSELLQSTARNKMVFMTSAANHISGLAGLTLTINLSKDGAAFSAISPAVTDRGNGWYSLALTAGMTDTLGDFVLNITGAAADPTDLTWEVVPAGGGTVTVGAINAGAITTASFAAGAINSTVAPNLDVAVSTRLATAGYTAPANADIATILTRTDVATSTRLGAASYTAPDNASISAIRAATDQLTFTVANRVDVNVRLMNGATVIGTGTAIDLWRGV